MYINVCVFRFLSFLNDKNAFTDACVEKCMLPIGITDNGGCLGHLKDYCG